MSYTYNKLRRRKPDSEHSHHKISSFVCYMFLDFPTFLPLYLYTWPLIAFQSKCMQSIKTSILIFYIRASIIWIIRFMLNIFSYKVKILSRFYLSKSINIIFQMYEWLIKIFLKYAVNKKFTFLFICLVLCSQNSFSCYRNKFSIKNIQMCFNRIIASKKTCMKT